MPKHRFKIDQPRKVYSALVVAGDAARETALVGDFDLGPWDDAELRDSGVVEIIGPDEAVTLVVERWIAAGIGFEEL